MSKYNALTNDQEDLEKHVNATLQKNTVPLPPYEVYFLV